MPFILVVPHCSGLCRLLITFLCMWQAAKGGLCASCFSLGVGVPCFILGTWGFLEGKAVCLIPKLHKLR